MTFHLLRLLPVFFLSIELGAQIPAPAPAASESSKQEDALNRLTPRSSVVSFLDAVREGRDQTAAQYLNLDKLSREDQRTKAAALARRLGQALDRDPRFDVAKLSRLAEGNADDGLPADRDRVGQFMIGSIPLELQRRKDLTAEVWVFAPESVALIPQLEAISEETPLEQLLPSVLVRTTLLGTSLWRLIAMVLLAIAATAVSRRLSNLFLFLSKPLCRRIAPGRECDVETLLHPLRLLVTVALFRTGLVWIMPSALMRFYVGRLLGALTVIGVVWLLSGILDIAMTRARSALGTRHTTLSRTALPLVSRILKAILVILAATATLANWGFDMTAILAGVGIGGIAIALAAQKTVENLFGGLALITDAPVMVGDFCKFGDRVGTVEDIGLRSTRIRTLDRTIVTIPNAEFSSMTLENFSRRDKIWFHPTFSLRRDATPDQLRQIEEAIRSILNGHPKVEVGGVPVRFVGTGDYSMNIETFAYVLTSNFDEYLRVQEQLLLAILDAISEAGTALAIPTQASVHYAVEGAKQEDQGNNPPWLGTPAEPQPAR